MRIVCSLVSVTVIFQLELFIILNVNYLTYAQATDRNSVYSPEAVSAPPGELILGTGKWTIHAFVSLPVHNYVCVFKSYYYFELKMPVQSDNA